MKALFGLWESQWSRTAKNVFKRNESLKNTTQNWVAAVKNICFCKMRYFSFIKSYFIGVRQTQNPSSTDISGLILLFETSSNYIQLKVKIVGYLRLRFIFAHLKN
tara:strand:+ start:154 stop:468 length:315 start_codon:yes stop_codon:yes gene_type:complete